MQDTSYIVNGYPTETAITAVQNFRGTPHGLVVLLSELWAGGEYVIVNDSRDDLVEVRFITVGWSGNEDLIAAMEKSLFGMMFLESSHRGGLHIYRIPTAKWNTKFSNLPLPVRKMEFSK
jgi:hypothetical protein